MVRPGLSDQQVVSWRRPLYSCGFILIGFTCTSLRASNESQQSLLEFLLLQNEQARFKIRSLSYKAAYHIRFGPQEAPLMETLVGVQDAKPASQGGAKNMARTIQEYRSAKVQQGTIEVIQSGKSRW